MGSGGLGHGCPRPLGLHPPLPCPSGVGRGQPDLRATGPCVEKPTGQGRSDPDTHPSLWPPRWHLSRQLLLLRAEQTVVRAWRPQAPRCWGCWPQVVLTLPGPSGLSSRSMEEMLSRLFRRPMPAAKGLAMMPGDTCRGTGCEQCCWLPTTLCRRPVCDSGQPLATSAHCVYHSRFWRVAGFRGSDVGPRGREGRPQTVTPGSKGLTRWGKGGSGQQSACGTETD